MLLQTATGQAAVVSKNRVNGLPASAEACAGVTAVVFPEPHWESRTRYDESAVGSTDVNLVDPSGHNPCSHEECDPETNRALAASDRGADISGAVGTTNTRYTGHRTYRSPYHQVSTGTSHLIQQNGDGSDVQQLQIDQHHQGEIAAMGEQQYWNDVDAANAAAARNRHFITTCVAGGDWLNGVHRDCSVSVTSAAPTDASKDQLCEAAFERHEMGECQVQDTAAVSSSGDFSWWPVQKPNGAEDGLDCTDCARLIQQRIGGDIVRLQPNDAPWLGQQSGSGLQSGRWAYHDVVQKDGRIYDSYTGPDGLTVDEYMRLFPYPDEISRGPVDGGDPLPPDPIDPIPPVG